LHLTVRHTESLTPTVKLFRLATADGSHLPLFTAGSHIKIQVTLPDGRADERHYSLINSHNQHGEYVIAVQREANGRGGSAFMHGLAVGDSVMAAGPSNDFPLAIGATLHVLIAGGIGITPILSMAHALRAAGQPFEFHYAARTPASMAFREAVEGISDGRAQLCFDEGNAARGLRLGDIVGAPQNGRHVYVCGPKGMIEAVLKAAEERGWPKSHVHFESFGAAAQTGDGTIEVVLRRSGRTIAVPPQQSILGALLAYGIDHPHDCKRGECSTCQVDVIEGTPDNRDYCLFGPDYDAGKIMCVCVSRSKTPKLVLDL
jgi:ferredoxin-NADP reductase